MTADEVRRGDFIEFEDGDIIQVKGIHPSGKYFHNGKQWIEIFRFKPIPLTEEWLRGFGFDYLDNSFWNDGFRIYLKDNEFYILTEQKRVYLEFVHSLQNIYFCIEQKELYEKVWIK